MDLINATVLAQRMGVTAPAVSRWISSGKVSPVKVDGRNKWFDWDEIKSRATPEHVLIYRFKD